MKSNAIFFLVDALRYDIFADVENAREIAPNFASLIDRGFVRKAVANAQATQFVMPAIYSLTYPLDYGGYNTGIRNRPKSFVELLKDAGYSTHIMASCNQLGTTHGYGRGFDEEHTTFDCRHIMAYLIDKMLRYEVDLWRKGERDEAETIEVVQREMTLLLDGVERAVAGTGRTIWPARLRRINERVAAGCPGERDLLARDPKAVLHKLTHIRPIFYWRYLGKSRPTPDYIFWRCVESLRWRSREILISWNSPFFLVTHFETKAHEIIGGICRFIETAKVPWYLHLHLMDVHDCCSLSRFTVVLRWLRFFPRWMRARLEGKTNRRFNYDLSLMFVDYQFGKLLQTLDRLGQLEETVILVTGDHASAYAESPRRKAVIGERTHYEHIDVPMIVAGTDRRPSDLGLIDSMGITATFLDVLDVAPHASFKGRSVFGPGRDAVISESAGAGNADLSRKDLYFTVTTSAYRMMTILRGDQMEVAGLYDIVQDPRELMNLKGRAESAGIVESLLGHLYSERAEVLRMRGALPAGAAPLAAGVSG